MTPLSATTSSNNEDISERGRKQGLGLGRIGSVFVRDKHGLGFVCVGLGRAAEEGRVPSLKLSNRVQKPIIGSSSMESRWMFLTS